VWVDTHCHLDAAEFAADRDAVVARAHAVAVDCLVVPAVLPSLFDEVRTCCLRYPGCRPAYGIHPLYVDRAGTADLDTLAAWLAREPAVAVGEIGLDFYVPDADRERQQYFFDAQLALAARFHLPVLLHVRRAVDAVIAGLRRHRLPGGIAHAFNGSEQQARQLIDLGFCLGFGGSLTFAGSQRIRRLAATLPLAAIVLETDAPDIPPAWLQGGRNEPAELPRIATELAALRGIAAEELAAASGANARRMLPRLAADS
jgi:TatD DNase family protein